MAKQTQRQLLMAMTQKDRILSALKRRKLTQEQARKDLGVMSLSSRVRELRDDGYPIVSKPFTRKINDRKYTLVRYELAA